MGSSQGPGEPVRALSMRCSEVFTDFNMFGSHHEARRRLT
jgi:hypothetical protein